MVLLVLGLGLAAGQLLTRWVTPDKARSVVAAIALMGAAGTVVKGLVSW
jgi:hypothetical protein